MYSIKDMEDLAEPATRGFMAAAWRYAESHGFRHDPNLRFTDASENLASEIVLKFLADNLALFQKDDLAGFCTYGTGSVLGQGLYVSQYAFILGQAIFYKCQDVPDRCCSFRKLPRDWFNKAGELDSLPVATPTYITREGLTHVLHCTDREGEYLEKLA